MGHGISRIPMILARIYVEDTQFKKLNNYNYRVSPNATIKNEPSDAEKLIDNLGSMVEHRNTAQRNSRNLTQIVKLNGESLDSDFSFDSLAKQHAMASANTIWRRDTLVNATFEDFELLSIIGHGTFGKVYLVRERKKKTLHAMKCIRKDIVIEHESVESLEVEKLILLQVNHPFIIGMDYVF
jgi:hypothetical protein